MSELTDPLTPEVDTDDMTDDDVLTGRRDDTPGLARYTLGKLKAYFLAGISAFPSLTGNAGKVLTVNAEEDDVEWTEPASGGGGIEEAPADGKTYGRQDEEWVELTSGGGGSAGEKTATIVQYVASDNAQPLTLPAPPTAGNFLVFVGVNQGLPAPNAGWILAVSGDDSNDRVDTLLLYRKVLEGDGDAHSPYTGGGAGLCYLVEIESSEAAWSDAIGWAGVQAGSVGAINEITASNGTYLALTFASARPGDTGISVDSAWTTELTQGGDNRTGKLISKDGVPGGVAVDPGIVYTGAEQISVATVFFHNGTPKSFNGVGVEEDGVPVASAVTAINFAGSGVTVTDEGGGRVTVEVTSSGTDPNPDAHRYWRIVWDSNQGGGESYSGTREASFLNEYGAPIAVLGAGVGISGSGTPYNTQPGSGATGDPIVAFDGNMGNRWQQEATTGAWVGWLFDDPVNVGGFTIAESTVYDQTFKTGRLQWSDDGAAWNTRFVVNDPQTGWAGSEIRTFRDPALVIGQDVLTPPKASAFPIEINAPAVTDGLKALVMVSASGTPILRARLKTLPAGNFTVITKVQARRVSNYNGAGLIFRNSDGKYACVQLVHNDGLVPALDTFSNANTFNAGAAADSKFSYSDDNPTWLRADYNATTKVISAFWSYNGLDWVAIGTTNYLNDADAVGFGTPMNHLSAPCTAFFEHWAQS